MSEGDLRLLFICSPVFEAFCNIQGENKHLHEEQKYKLKHFYSIYMFEKGANIILIF